MAGKRTGKRSKSRGSKKIRKAAARRGSKPKARAKGRKARPKARPKPKSGAKSRARARGARAVKRVKRAQPARRSGPSSRGKAPLRTNVAPRSPAAAAAAMSAKSGGKGRSRLQARGSFERGEPQGLLEFDEGPVAAESPREPELGALPPIPKKRRSKGGQLNMLDYPGESLTVGMPAPEFSLPSTLGRRVSLSEFRGKRVILYFYPKDDTPGCTMEACGFRDSFPRIESKDAIVLGVSLDDELSHERFAQKYNLPFPLLSDKDAAVSRQYGTYKEKSLYGRSFWGIERTTFVIDRDGKVEHVFRRVKVEGHAEEVMATLAL